MDAVGAVAVDDEGLLAAVVDSDRRDHAAFTRLVALHDRDLVRLAYLVVGAGTVRRPRYRQIPARWAFGGAFSSRAHREGR